MAIGRNQPFRPFITAASRHDVLGQLARRRHDLVDETVNAAISKQIGGASGAPGVPPKQDGKNGTLDGVVGWVDWIQERMGPVPPEKGFKDDKDHKEEKEGKEDKDGKEQKDGKESKEGKEAKDSKEGAKDQSDGGKLGASEASDPFLLYGRPESLSWRTMNEIAKTQAARVGALLRRSAII